MMNICRQAELRKLISPRTGAPLMLDAENRRLSSVDGKENFTLIDGRVPVLLEDEGWAARYRTESPVMAAEYARDPSSQPARRNWWHAPSLYSRKAADAVKLVLDPLSDDALCLSIGGGPNRAHPKLCNLNIGPFPNVDVIADAHNLPYATESVDAVYSAAVFEHLHTPNQAAAEVQRVLRPGARAFIDSPFVFLHHGYPHHYQNYTITGHRLLFERQGLKVIDAGVSNGPAYAVTQIMNHFIREYMHGFSKWAFKRLWRAMVPLIRRIDMQERNVETAHILAANTYVVVKKP